MTKGRRQPMSPSPKTSPEPEPEPGPAYRKAPRSRAGVGGRPTKITQELTERVAKLVRAGNYLETAAAMSGINRATLHDWLKKGARYNAGVGRNGAGRRVGADRVYAEFSDAVEQALAQAEAMDVMRIGQAAAGVSVPDEEAPDGRRWVLSPQWRAAAWRLERRNARRWGRRETLPVELDVVDEGPVQVDLVEELRRAMDEARQDPPPPGEPNDDEDDPEDLDEDDEDEPEGGDEDEDDDEDHDAPAPELDEDEDDE